MSEDDWFPTYVLVSYLNHSHYVHTETSSFNIKTNGCSEKFFSIFKLRLFIEFLVEPNKLNMLSLISSPNSLSVSSDFNHNLP